MNPQTRRGGAAVRPQPTVMLPSDRRGPRRGHSVIMTMTMAMIAGLLLLFGAGSAQAQHHHHHHRAHRERAAQASPGVSAPHSSAPVPRAGHADPAGDDDAGAKVRKAHGGKEKVFNFTGFELAGSVRMPQLFYFLDRAQEELERASLKKRSFVPELVKSVDEEDS